MALTYFLGLLPTNLQEDIGPFGSFWLQTSAESLAMISTCRGVITSGESTSDSPEDMILDRSKGFSVSGMCFPKYDIAQV